jgi:hypothetical protein
MVILARENPSWVSTKTVHPAIPVPNLQSVWVRWAIQRTFKEIERSRRDGIFHVHRMPRLIGLPAYANETFRGFKWGRPPGKTAIESSNRVIPHPPQEARPAVGINWRLVLR